MRNYGDLSTGELREMCVNGELDADLMSLSDYERLFDYETDLDEPQSSVLVFCSNGLNQHEAYGKHLPKPSLESVYERHEQMFGGKSAEPQATPKAKKRQFAPTSRWGKLVATFVAVFIGAALLAQGVAYAFGYNLIEMFWNAISNPERFIGDSSGDNEMNFTNNTRFYNSMEEMLETENLNILYPARLPGGYVFSDFIVTDTTRFTIRFLSAEPFLEFTIDIGANVQIENYDYEIDGMKFYIIERDGLHQAGWSDSGDYYTVVVGDSETLLKIINNLARE
jgi:hypothetical protein